MSHSYSTPMLKGTKDPHSISKTVLKERKNVPTMQHNFSNIKYLEETLSMMHLLGAPFK